MTPERKAEWIEILSLSLNDNNECTIDVEQMWKELQDFDDMIERHQHLVCLATDMSKVTYTPEGLTAAYNDKQEVLRKDWEKDFIEDHDITL